MAKSLHPYDRSSLLTLGNPDYVADLERFVMGAYASDAGGGDLAAEGICARAHETAIKSEKRQVCRAEVMAKSAGIFCGKLEAAWFSEKIGSSGGGDGFSVEFLVQDGDSFTPGTPLLRLTGDAQTIFGVERTLLNTLQRLSGITTLTREFVKRVEAAAPGSCRVAATRKTLYGLLDKRAVAVGGGLTHRLSLSDAPMFKSNHLKLLNFEWDMLAEVFERLPKDLPFVTVEVTDFAQAQQILGMWHEWQHKEGNKNQTKFFLLFDNFSSDELVAGLKTLPKPDGVYFEASGGITLANVTDYAKTGVDVVSIGALTHSVPALDFSLKLSH